MQTCKADNPAGERGDDDVEAVVVVSSLPKGTVVGGLAGWRVKPALLGERNGNDGLAIIEVDGPFRLTVCVPGWARSLGFEAQYLVL